MDLMYVTPHPDPPNTCVEAPISTVAAFKVKK